jgi:hypothetical protein
MAGLGRVNHNLEEVLARRGHKLPPEFAELERALAALRHARQAQAAAATDPSDIRRELVDRLVDSARSGALDAAVDAGQDVVDLAPLAQHRELVAFGEERRKVIDSAIERVTHQIEQTARLNYGRILGELGLAIAETVEQATPLVAGGRSDGKLAELAERYRSVRHAFWAMDTLVRGSLERDRNARLLGEFTIAGLDRAWPGWDEIRTEIGLGGSNAAWPPDPWPADPIGRFTWIVRSNIELWMPTREQLKEALKEVADRRWRAEAEASAARHPDQPEPGTKNTWRSDMLRSARAEVAKQ